MKFFVVLIALVGYVACADTADETCYDSITRACSTSGNDDALPNCNAKYGAIDNIEIDLQKFVTAHIAHSFDYLLMSSHFGNYEKNRDGFKQLFRKLSDSTWNDAIGLIKYITKRGGVMGFHSGTSKDFHSVAREEESGAKTFEVHELGSLTRALEAQKSLAVEAHRIHREVTRQREHFHDPEVASFLENNFVHKHADSIRDLSGHSNDLKRLIDNNKQTSLAIFLFDEYLQKL